jgi:hypothetical protein
MQGEKKLSNGERKGKIVGKRYKKLQEVGFSPKNFVQLFRLANVGINFFSQNKYIVDSREFPDDLRSFLMSVKTTPENHKVEKLNEYANKLEKDLVKAYENRVVDLKFDEDLLNDILVDIYMPVLVDNQEGKLNEG